MNRFVTSLLWMILVWTCFYGYEIYKQLWTADALWFQIIMGFIFFLNAMIYVPHGETRELVNRITQRTVRVLDEGVFFKPFLGLFWKVYDPLGDSKENKIKINLDLSTKDVFRHRQITSRREDFLITIFTWLFPILKSSVYGKQ